MTLSNDGGSARNIARDLDASMSEAAWLREIMAYADKHGWLCAHFRPARTNKGYRTAMQGNAGFPDCVFAKDGVVIFVELKASGKKGSLTSAQSMWLKACKGFLWSPKDREEMHRILENQ